MYSVVLTKAGKKSRLGIDYGTSDSAKCCIARARIYEYKKHMHLPRFVREAYDKGYGLEHIGILCWIPLPFMVGKPRLRFLA